MSTDGVAITGFIVLFVLMLLRVPIGMAMGLVGVSGFAYLSGGGSTLCALATGHEEAIAESMLDAARIRDVEGYTIVTKPTAEGATLVDGER